jgi:hypothetical protein
LLALVAYIRVLSVDGAPDAVDNNDGVNDLGMPESEHRL